MGSGTTLMRLIVDSHDNIAIAQETSRSCAPTWRTSGSRSTGTAATGTAGSGWSDDELDERMREFYAGMFERFAAGQGKKRWGDKTPWHAWHLRELARVFPDAVFIAMVRQPGAVATSVSERFRLDWGGAVNHWVNTTTEQVQRGHRARRPAADGPLRGPGHRPRDHAARGVLVARRALVGPPARARQGARRARHGEEGRGRHPVGQADRDRPDRRRGRRQGPRASSPS